MSDYVKYARRRVLQICAVAGAGLGGMLGFAADPALASYDGAAELDRGLDLLLTGLTATLIHPDGSPRTA